MPTLVHIITHYVTLSLL